jgi:carbon starvation protein
VGDLVYEDGGMKRSPTLDAIAWYGGNSEGMTHPVGGKAANPYGLQDMLGNVWPKLGETSWMPSVIFTSALVLGCWGYFLYIGVIDPYGGVNLLWPLFGIANQMLAAIALCVGTSILIKSGKLRYAWITGVPLSWLVLVTTTAAWEKIFSSDIRVGFLAAANDMSAKLAAGALPPEKAAVAPQLIFNQHLDAWLTVFFVTVLWVIVLDMLRVCSRSLAGKPVPPISESPHQPSRLVEDYVRD